MLVFTYCSSFAINCSIMDGQAMSLDVGLQRWQNLSVNNPRWPNTRDMATCYGDMCTYYAWHIRTHSTTIHYDRYTVQVRYLSPSCEQKTPLVLFRTQSPFKKNSLENIAVTKKVHVPLLCITRVVFNSYFIYFVQGIMLLTLFPSFDPRNTPSLLRGGWK